MPKEPTYGYTASGVPVHSKAIDHMPTETRTQRFNQWFGLKVTTLVGTMWAAYIFAVIATIALPSALSSGSILELVIWLSSSFLQLVLLPIIIVGQQIQSKAADARSAKTFEDTETLLGLAADIVGALDTSKPGGITEVRDELLSAIQKIEKDHEE